MLECVGSNEIDIDVDVQFIGLSFFVCLIPPWKMPLNHIPLIEEWILLYSKQDNDIYVTKIDEHIVG